MESSLKAKDATGNPLTITSVSGQGRATVEHARSVIAKLTYAGEGGDCTPQVKFPIYRMIRTNVTSLKSTAQIN